MVFVILLLTLLTVLGAGYTALVQFRLRSGAQNSSYATALVRARSVHRAVCVRIEEGSGALGEALEPLEGNAEDGEMVFRGKGENEDLAADITVVVRKGQAEIATESRCGGYHFSFFTRVFISGEEGDG